MFLFIVKCHHTGSFIWKPTENVSNIWTQKNNTKIDFDKFHIFLQLKTVMQGKVENANWINWGTCFKEIFNRYIWQKTCYSISELFTRIKHSQGWNQDDWFKFDKS